MYGTKTNVHGTLLRAVIDSRPELIIIMIIIMAEMTAFYVAAWLSHRGKAQIASKSMLSNRGQYSK